MRRWKGGRNRESPLTSLLSLCPFIKVRRPGRPLTLLPNCRAKVVCISWQLLVLFSCKKKMNRAVGPARPPARPPPPILLLSQTAGHGGTRRRRCSHFITLNESFRLPPMPAKRHSERILLTNPGHCPEPNTRLHSQVESFGSMSTARHSPSRLRDGGRPRGSTIERSVSIPNKAGK